jgi:hypothetical protein
MKDFWISCGHHLLDRNDSGGLVVTDEFLKAYFVRPELMPPDEACDVERRLHRDLLADPRRQVAPREIETMADADARENWRFVLAFRDLLLRHATLEAAYLALIRSDSVQLPPLFVNQLVHVILRNALDGCEDAFVLRAAELFFRTQRLMLHESSVLLGDAEVIGGVNPTPVLSLMSMLGAVHDVEVEVLDDDNAEHYWHRSDQFDMGLDLTAGRRGQAALATVIVRWLSHLLGIDVSIEPLTELRDARLTWYVGLDTDATAIGDRLWRGEALDEETNGRVLGLYRLTFAVPALVLEEVGREPIYLIMAMSAQKLVRLKPQNLLTGLPIRHLEAAT